MRFLMFVFFCIFSSTVFSQTVTDRFKQEEASIVSSVESGKITMVEGAREILSASKAYFPSDTLTHAYYESVLNYAERMERKEIKHDKAIELLEIRTKRFHEALHARAKEQELQRVTKEQEAARLRAIAEAEQQEYARQQAIGSMLRGVGNSFRNAYGNGTNCTTSMYGNQAFTNCR